MSDSRLEKFIYAICSMDVSDLPVPLSRIEKLWNCLITGETPDFEPLSRNEKYLMAMLDRYDISNLPAPMSRGEKLLYKIAVGETDLSDVPGYLSRYEELLKYLIENGGISGGDFEYVLHTLNQSLNTLYLTAEKPVKSAVLSGQTLVNLINVKNTTGGIAYTTIDLKLAYELPVGKYILFYDIIKANTSSGLGNPDRHTPIVTFNDDSKIYQGFEGFNTSKGKKYWIIDATKPIVKVEYWLANLVEDGEVDNLRLFTYQDGMENWDIPYFEGMQSVKMPVLTITGKNLINVPDTDKIGQETDITNAFKMNTDYTFSYHMVNNSQYETRARIDVYNIDGTMSYYGAVTPPNTIKTTSQTFRHTKPFYKVSVLALQYYETNASGASVSQIQLEEGSATTYEPFKSNILTVNEDVELRGIGDVQDTLDCLTGEVTQRIRKIVLDGTQYMDADGRGIYIQVDDMKKVEDYRTIITCDKLPVFYHQWDLPNVENGIAGYLDEENKYPGQNWLYIKVNNSIDVGEVRQILTQNPITVQYQRVADSIKTVDLTVVDQDNQPTQLGTFENVTHVSLEAENLIPEVEMEVATKLLEDTVFNLTNAFNTLYPTAETPVKSAILSGQTLVNISSLNGEITIKPNSNQFIDSPLIKQNTTYTFMFNCTSAPSTGFIEIRQVFSNAALKIENINVVQGYNKFKLTTVNKEVARFRLKNESTSETDFVFNNLLILEGDYTNQDISYFEGMQSVKMPVLTTIGKNLFDKTKITTDKLIVGTGAIITSTGNAFTDYIPVEAGKTYIRNIAAATIAVYDTDKNFIERTKAETTFSATANGYIRWNFNSYASVLDTMQIEEGSTVTPYEPYKTNILTTSEDIMLGSVDGAYDTLDSSTGNIISRTELYTYKGEIEPYFNQSIGGYVVSVGNNAQVTLQNGIISDKFSLRTFTDYDTGVYGNSNGFFYIFDKLVSSAQEFKEKHIGANFRYRLLEESVKTVDLTVVDQDGNVTTLKTFDDTTHVLLNSEGLIPTAALTVRTTIPSASSTSLLMDDISTNQQQLNTTVDKQSENVDATMIATTEIFEETL